MIPFTLPSTDGINTLACYRTETQNPRALVQLCHGMCEHFAYYREFAEFLAQDGILAFGDDHLGHGYTPVRDRDRGFFAEQNGADHLVMDEHQLSLYMKAQYPGIPLILFGHSMGSFIVRETVARYGNDYTAAIFCGTAGPDTPAGLGVFFADLIARFRGKRYRSEWIESVAFHGYNQKYGPGVPFNAWITRDEEHLKRHTDDPFCRFNFSVSAYHDMFTLLKWVSSRKWAKRLPASLPVLLITGDMDPVGDWGKGVRKVTERLCRAGMEQVSLRVYPEMRHELLEEIGREQVMKETKQWLERFI